MSISGKTRILIAKTTHLGDVVIALPLAGVLKFYYPETQILFLSRGAGCDIARRYVFIDEVYDADYIKTAADLKACQADIFIQVNPEKRLAAMAKEAGIPVRIGSIYRVYHWFLCNRHAIIGRAWEGLNKRQLDLHYLKPLGLKQPFSLQDLTFLYQFKSKLLPEPWKAVMASEKIRIILHPSSITAKNYQWPLKYYAELIHALDPGRFQVFITGVESDRAYLADFLAQMQGKVVDTVGQMNVDELITFISHCDVLIAGSTGPLHLAAALGIHAIGIYRANLSYICRWKPVGKKVMILAGQGNCRCCPTGDPCQCILAVTPEKVRDAVLQFSMLREPSE